MNTQLDIIAYYDSNDALRRIDAHLREQGIDPEHPTLEALAPYDNFHTRGPAATLDLISLAGFPAGARVLDVGGGWGGPARLLANRANVHVTVLDLTPSSVDTGRILTDRLGMNGSVDFTLGDGTDMPFSDGSFDGVWTQHSTMNIANKTALYREAHRVLKPGGRLAMHEIIAGNGDPVEFPVPWATSPEISFLLPAEELRALIIGIGFREISWDDETQRVISEGILPRGNAPADRLPKPGIAFGPSFAERIETLDRNFRSGSLSVVRALFEWKEAATG